MRDTTLLAAVSLSLSLYIYTRLGMIEKSQELCENRGGRPGLPVRNKPYGFWGRKHLKRWSSLIMSLDQLETEQQKAKQRERERDRLYVCCCFQNNRVFP